MKRFHILLLFAIFCLSSLPKLHAQTALADSLHFRWQEGATTIPLTIDSAYILVKFQDTVPFHRKFMLLSQEKQIESFDEQMELPGDPGFAVLPLKAGTTSAQARELLRRLRRSSRVAYANPFLYDPEGGHFSYYNRFFVKLRRPQDYGKLLQAVQQYGAEIVGPSDLEEDLYEVEVDGGSAGDALGVANRLMQTNVFEFVEGDWVFINISSQNISPYDPLHKNQWFANGMLAGNIVPKIDLIEAWGITKGDKNIKVAILDDGVELAHPDLKENLLQGYDATNDNNAGAPNRNDFHGTACAGIVGAEENSIGTIGIAPQCKIIPIRVYHNAPGCSNGGTVLSNILSTSWLAKGIKSAYQNDADIISMSLGIKFRPFRFYLIENQILNAFNNGRNGKGTIIISASGNDSLAALNYPATQSKSYCGWSL